MIAVPDALKNQTKRVILCERNDEGRRFFELYTNAQEHAGR